MRNKLMYFRKKILFLPLLLSCMMLNGRNRNIAYAKGFEAEDYSTNVYFDQNSFAKGHNYKYLNGTREPWNFDGQEERREYFVFDTGRFRIQTVSTIDAYHERGKESLNLGVGASLLTEEETQNTLGLDSSTKIGIVIIKIGGGWKWGSSNSKTISSEGYANIDSNRSTGYYKRTAKCVVREYYLVTRNVTRTVVKDKKGNITGYSNYRSGFADNTGKFENFDFSQGVEYQTSKR